MAAPYELIYYVGVPGRGEHIRLALEEAGAEYTDTASLPMDKCREFVTSYLTPGPGNPPYYAPPLFKHGDLVISQTSNILMYLGSKLGLAGANQNDEYRVNALALTALDGLSNEVHDSHHPIAVELYYEDQREESKRRCQEWIKTRLPKHLGYWERALASDEGGNWLLGKTFTYADLVLFQCLDGCKFAFPKAMSQAKESGKYNRVFRLWEDVKARPNVAAYLASEKRQKYDWGIYRYYPDNDVLAE
ncbi:glutathione S-transferase protein-like protein [Aaosphaeria arxii CBS 175.79]|uniref:Glutathione S-transferase protein-like protein n=1 Tax=Aaosphaeria arxii CBS 175.79 TaxID=1450172 RepID=A0A6A5XKI6_9PLEO|nr:glutathione S-transferase protein-like protein [Aaosphaeria arxii CBS 175.79]KAF2013463.1 glutathione S-transferase protein-like protein [Aaosphaeria arxii CBS 175.79]